jgi:hypothetical protein
LNRRRGEAETKTSALQPNPHFIRSFCAAGGNTMPDNAKTVARIYEAFAKGDLPTILDNLADDVDWFDFPTNSGTDAGLPWAVRRRGKAETVKFFESLAANMTFNEIKVGAIVGAGDHVAAQFHYACTLKNGARLKLEDLHWWTFNAAGKVAAYRHYTDTAATIEAFRRDQAKAA